MNGIIRPKLVPERTEPSCRPDYHCTGSPATAPGPRCEWHRDPDGLDPRTVTPEQRAALEGVAAHFREIQGLLAVW